MLVEIHCQAGDDQVRNNAGNKDDKDIYCKNDPSWQITDVAKSFRQKRVFYNFKKRILHFNDNSGFERSLSSAANG